MYTVSNEQMMYLSILMNIYANQQLIHSYSDHINNKQINPNHHQKMVYNRSVYIPKKIQRFQDYQHRAHSNVN